MIFNKLDACHCDSKKLVKETLSQMNRSEFRKDITDITIVKTWNEKYKSRNDLFYRHHLKKRFEELYNLNFLKRIYVFLEKSC